jgi:membrane-bound metal-dependent hydrolase YbcI (DUF457 family)
VPFTPFHFGIHGVIGWPLRRWIDWPVFILASVAIDIEPLLVMYYKFDVPIHWICHSFLGGAAVGLIWAVVAYQMRGIFRFFMRLLRLPYETGFRQMMIAGVLGAWLHVLVDAFLYGEMNPFWPLKGNPFHQVLSRGVVWFACDLCLVAAVVAYVSWLVYFQPRANGLDRRHPAE